MQSLTSKKQWLNYNQKLKVKEVNMMKLMRWEPFKEVLPLRDQIDRLFHETFFRPSISEVHGEIWSWVPAVDIYEDSERLLIKAELPEMDLKDIDLKIENNTLTIKGERKLEGEDKKENYQRVERVYGSFCRNFSLPLTVEVDKVKATYDRGVLKIDLPKKEEIKPKAIPIEVKS
jgi:HSP20 family protein